MSRPIKFRAWDKRWPKNDPEFSMAYQGDADIETLGSFAHHYLWDDNAIDSGDLVIMLGTGLNDKNGVEIFEGDVLKSPWTRFDDDERPYIVDYEDACFYASNEEVDDHYQLADIEWEVIGNVYEHGQLLEQAS
ncbi:hypothetical protein HAV21_03390 [Paenarthrobacter sp. MSM-2-10-13]|uniref:YopX family protein n=1 Tax=Paenarthrobacter sp. MSM-2-10-13 TaxID=2717318 RepID=UPI001420114E|nr:hypothetical protein [Paenarthrobacter sp. MSM-2-10-13]